MKNRLEQTLIVLIIIISHLLFLCVLPITSIVYIVTGFDTYAHTVDVLMKRIEKYYGNESEY